MSIATNCNNSQQSNLLTTVQAIDFLNKIGIDATEHWLRRQRIKSNKSEYIPYYKIGKRVYYKIEDLQSFVDSKRVA